MLTKSIDGWWDPLIIQLVRSWPISLRYRVFLDPRVANVPEKWRGKEKNRIEVRLTIPFVTYVMAKDRGDTAWLEAVVRTAVRDKWLELPEFQDGATHRAELENLVKGLSQYVRNSSRLAEAENSPGSLGLLPTSLRGGRSQVPILGKGGENGIGIFPGTGGWLRPTSSPSVSDSQGKPAH